MEKHEKIWVVDLGSQYTQLIARRIRELEVYSEVKHSDITAEDVSREKPLGIILSGGPASTYQYGSPSIDERILSLGIPILGICYGLHLIGRIFGGKVVPAKAQEYGKTELQVVDTTSPLFTGLNPELICWMSHGDILAKPPQGFTVTARTFHSPVAAMENRRRNLFAVQFHPEVTHTPWGMNLLRNFIFDVCGATGTWKVSSFVDESIERIRELVEDSRVLVALSGGIDSLTTAVLVQRSVGKQLFCIFVDHGLMRLREADQVEAVFKRQFAANFRRVNAAERFLRKLRGVEHPERKRKIIGAEFVRVFEEEASRLKDVRYMAQGTIYPDVIESHGVGSHGKVIKSHHNVGGLPKKMKLRLLEPLRDLFKDEVRKVALNLGVPESVVHRQPFPGPGLAIRIIGKVTRRKIKLLQMADAILQEELTSSEIYTEIAQAFCVLPTIRSVGVMGDRRSYGYPIIVRAVTTVDFMTADWARIPYSVLETISSRIINEVPEVNRVAYDISSKPPATIEWE
ncbi:MAG: glutamine-hydrolyzing GMP synthase [Planctomycetales bacterium 4484_113]|nr:MAG: glutamine-hydrolyzing GMP synthase [Planctomycetales bacterium 4484_113]